MLLISRDGRFSAIASRHEPLSNQHVMLGWRLEIRQHGGYQRCELQQYFATRSPKRWQLLPTIPHKLEPPLPLPRLLPLRQPLQRPLPLHGSAAAAAAWFSGRCLRRCSTLCGKGAAFQEM
jgi:hypothetical protein